MHRIRRTARAFRIARRTAGVIAGCCAWFQRCFRRRGGFGWRWCWCRRFRCRFYRLRCGCRRFLNHRFGRLHHIGRQIVPHNRIHFGWGRIGGFFLHGFGFFRCLRWGRRGCRLLLGRLCRAAVFQRCRSSVCKRFVVTFWRSQIDKGQFVHRNRLGRLFAFPRQRQQPCVQQTHHDDDRGF